MSKARESAIRHSSPVAARTASSSGECRERQARPDKPVGNQRVEGERPGLDVGLGFEGGDETEGHAFEVNQLLGESPVLNDGPDSLAEDREPSFDLGGRSWLRPPPRRRRDPTGEDRQDDDPCGAEPADPCDLGELEPEIGGDSAIRLSVTARAVQPNPCQSWTRRNVARSCSKRSSGERHVSW